MIFNKVGKNQQGVALLMVMGIITILSALLVDFIFEVKVNKLRVYNQQDMMQARLNAESGLKLAMLRLEFYQEALNFLEKSPDKKKMVRPDLLNIIWSQPFVYPIPMQKDMDLIQKNALEEFEKNSLIQGQMSLTIQNISHLVNLNLLRAPEKKKASAAEAKVGSEEDDDEVAALDDRLIELLDQKFEHEREKHPDDFDEQYPYHDSELIVECIKYYISPESDFAGRRKGEVEGIFNEYNTRPKRAPLSSMTELYLIPCLNDSLIDLIKDHTTVHGVRAIDVNTMTDTTLKWLFPDITPDQSKAFFRYRDNPEKPHYFTTFEDFANYVTQKLTVIDKGAFDKRIQEFNKAGIKFGPTGSLFKVIALGKKNQATYTLTAYVSIPAYEPKPKAKSKPIRADGLCDEGYVLDARGEKCVLNESGKNPALAGGSGVGDTDEDTADEESSPVAKTGKEKEGKEANKTVRYLLPRIVETGVNS